MGSRMKFIFLVVLNSLWSVQASSPVVLWTLKRVGGGHSESNLNEFSPQQFADVLAWKSEQGNVPIIAFGLNSFSLEDLTPQGVGTAEPFRKLRRITDASAETLLYPAVQSAGDSISILHSKGFLVHKINAGDPLPKFEAPNTILVIEDKASVNMDDEILRVFSQYTLEYPNLVGMLWGKHSTWTEEPEDFENEILSRRKRQAPSPPPPTGPYSFNDDKGLLISFREVVLTMIHRNEPHKVNVTRADDASTTYNGTDVVVLTLKFPNTGAPVTTTQFEMTMKFEKDKFGYYAMTNNTVTLKGRDSQAFSFEDMRLSSAVGLALPIKESFHCSRFGSLYPTQKLENHTFTIDIKGFQVQAFQPPATTQFVDAYECVGFFSAGIWSGIFVTLILISILTWGLKMILDVKTMDRFDDPKGKPISFGSGD